MIKYLNTDTSYDHIFQTIGYNTWETIFNDVELNSENKTSFGSVALVAVFSNA